MNDTLKGKHILFLSIGFYDYDNYIINALRQRGADVVFFNAWKWSLVQYILLRFFRQDKFFLFFARRNMLHFAKKIKGQFDIVFVIKGDFLSIKTLQTLKTKIPKAKYIIYEYDSLERYPYLLEFFKFFDRVLSFDFKDCQEHNLIYRPLFSRVFQQNNTKKDIDLYFIGGMHSNRLFSIYSLYKKFNDTKKIVFYLLCGRVEYLKLLFNKNIDKDFIKQCIITRPLAYNIYLSYLKRAKNVLDLYHPQQTGLTMRTIETLCSGCFLITTNENIKKESNIPPPLYQIVKENELDKLQLQQHYALGDTQEYIQKYTIQSFLEDIFQGC